MAVQHAITFENITCVRTLLTLVQHTHVFPRDHLHSPVEFQPTRGTMYVLIYLFYITFSILAVHAMRY